MNSPFVLDASVAVAWALPSQAAEGTSQLLDEVAAGRPFLVPVLWTFEVANALVALARRRRITGEECVRAGQALGRLPATVDGEGPGLALGPIWRLAEEYSLSVYDAAYLELAVRRNLPLASRDAGLNRAARRCRLATML